MNTSFQKAMLITLHLVTYCQSIYSMELDLIANQQNNQLFDQSYFLPIKIYVEKYPDKPLYALETRFGQAGQLYVSLAKKFQQSVLKNDFTQAKLLLIQGADIHCPYEYYEQSIYGMRYRYCSGDLLNHLYSYLKNCFFEDERNKREQQIQFLLDHGAKPQLMKSVLHKRA